jgi:hypothetical protein
MTVTATSMTSDELTAVVSALRQRFPQLPAVEVETVVARVYEELAATAKVTAHLIPLTLNRSRRLLTDERDEVGRAEAQSATGAYGHHREGLLATSPQDEFLLG